MAQINENMESSLHIAVVVFGYFLGSIPFGLLAGKLFDVDVRNAGSGNIGATNVARTVGKRIAILVLLLDALKGAGAVLIARQFCSSVWVPELAGLTAVLGHCFPIWLRFRGGKGVATSLGVFLVLAPIVAVFAMFFWVLSYAIFKIASVGSILCAIGFPLAMYKTGKPEETIAIATLIGAVIILRHWSNLLRLLGKSELRV